MSFKIGDVVRLKSGGPAMTVTGVPSNGSGVLTCIWFVGTSAAEASTVNVHTDALEAYERPRSSVTSF